MKKNQQRLTEFSWSAEPTNDVKRFDVAFPMHTVRNKPIDLCDYVRLTVGTQSVVLRVDRTTRNSGTLTTLGVSTKAFEPGTVSTTMENVTVFRASAAEWYQARWRADKAFLAGVVGLAMAFVGVLIDASLALGKEVPLIRLPVWLISALIVLKYLLQVGGLGLAFFKGVLEGNSK